MWTSIVDLDPKRVLLTQMLGRIWRGAYFASFAPLRVQNVPREPLPARNWVRVRNRLAGISGNDLHLVYADGDFRVAPATLPTRGSIYPGDEAMGEVIEIGDDVQDLRVGDRVVLQAGPNCLSSGVQPLCRACAHGSYDLCEYGQQPGPYPIGGGWSEEMLLHEQQLFCVPPTLSDEQAVLLKPTSVALHAILRRLPQPGDHVLIVGAGTIGLLILQILRQLTPQAEISVLARHAFQVEQATRMGATHIIYPQDAYQSVQRATHARLFNGLIGNQMLLGGYDIIFDAVGSRKTLYHALRWTRANGTVVLIGRSSHFMQIDLTPIWHQEINLLGSSGLTNEQWPLGTQERRSTMGIASELIEHGQLHPEQLITHRFALNDYRSALTSVANKARSRAIMVLFDFSLLPPSVVPNAHTSLRRPTDEEQLASPAPLTAIPAAFRTRHIPQSEQPVQAPAFLSNYADEIPVTPNLQRKPDAPLLLPEYDHTLPTTTRRRPTFFIEEDSEDVSEDTSPAIRAVRLSTHEQAPSSPAPEQAHQTQQPTQETTLTSSDTPPKDAPDAQERPQPGAEYYQEPVAIQANEEPSQAYGGQTQEMTIITEIPVSVETEQPLAEASVTAEPSPTLVELATPPANEEQTPEIAEPAPFPAETDGQTHDAVEQIPFPAETDGQAHDAMEQVPSLLSEADMQTHDAIEQIPFPAEADEQTHDAVEQIPFPSEADEQTHDAVEQAPSASVDEVQTQDTGELAPIPSEADAQAQHAVEQVPSPSDFEGLPADVSEPAPWTWLSYLEKEQIATPLTPEVAQTAEEQAKSATETTSDALLPVEGSPISEEGQRAPARKRSRKATQQDKNT